ncbi:MAG: PTS lactose/cellobiose transporter subunit IIA [Catenibacterium sp.]|uniref:PTS lactose/cellobiose transporter subunit IIA n=1 Tax=Catenibacterium sp. TaxID=2049022 RepID=UPI003994DD30
MNVEKASFEIISHAGDSKSFYVMAMEYAKNGEFDLADEMIKKAKSELKKAHIIQYELIQEEARGNHIETNVLLVHAQDHLSMAIFMENYVDQIINLYKEISIMKGRYQHENFVSM